MLCYKAFILSIIGSKEILMKKLLFYIVWLLLSACGGTINDEPFTITYFLHNQSTHQIRIEAFFPNKILFKSEVIPINQN